MDRIRRLLPPLQVDVVVYHGNCSDGVASAALALIALGGAEKVRTLAATPGDDSNERKFREITTPQSRVLVVDFSYERDVLLRVQKSVAALVVLDHHETSRAALQDLDYCLFDMNRSGARLAWDYFFGESGRPVPTIVQYIEDRDLWTWRFGDTSKAFCAAFYPHVPLTPEEYALHIGAEMKRPEDRLVIETFIATGKVLLQHADSTVERRLKQAGVVTGRTSRCRYALIDEGMYVSEVGHALAKTHDFALLMCHDVSNPDRPVLKVSVRTLDGSKHSACNLAKHFGGGGHPQAAAFRWTRPVPDLIEALRAL